MVQIYNLADFLCSVCQIFLPGSRGFLCCLESASTGFVVAVIVLQKYIKKASTFCWCDISLLFNRSVKEDLTHFI